MAAEAFGADGQPVQQQRKLVAALAPQAERVGSVTKAATILGAFAPGAPVLSLRAIARETGIPRSTVHCLCVTLCDMGLLEEVPQRGYQLGSVLVALGGQVIARTGLIEAAKGLLGRAAHRDGTWADLGQLAGGWIVFLDRRTARHHGPMNTRVGLRAPAHFTGCGKAALSLLNDDEVAERVGQVCTAGSLSPPSMQKFTRQLAEARQRGYIVNTDWRPRRISVAAPVVDYYNGIMGGVSVGGPAHLFSPATIEQAAVDVVDLAARVGERLVFRAA